MEADHIGLLLEKKIKQKAKQINLKFAVSVCFCINQRIHKTKTI